jgi:hypothetical protein
VTEGFHRKGCRRLDGRRSGCCVLNERSCNLRVPVDSEDVPINFE